jgi:arsenite methyltransferase
MAEASHPQNGHIDYGLDAPGLVSSMFSRGGWTLGIGLLLFFINHSEYPAPATHLLLALGLIGVAFIAVGAVMVWSSRVAKLELRDRLLDGLNLKGDERVLDVGCGRGLLAIGAAKRLKSGRVTAIDVWSGVDLSGNSSDAVRENAKLEGVAEKVRVEKGDARKLVYPDAQYDAVISNLAIHNIEDPGEREHAVREMFRVLKSGGHIAMYDIFYAGSYAEVLQAAGAKDVTLSGLSWLWCVPGRTLTATK